MYRIKNIKWLPVLMALTILIIAGFQVYWLQNTYEREQRTLEMRTNILFRETIRTLQASKLKLERFNNDSTLPQRIFMHKEFPGRRFHFNRIPGQKMAGIVDALSKRIKDSNGKMVVITNRHTGDTVHMQNRNLSGRQNRLLQFLYDVDSLQDGIKPKEINTAFTRRLEEQSINVPFTVQQVPTVESDEPRFNEVT